MQVCLVSRHKRLAWWGAAGVRGLILELQEQEELGSLELLGILQNPRVLPEITDHPHPLPHKHTNPTISLRPQPKRPRIPRLATKQHMAQVGNSEEDRGRGENETKPGISVRNLCIRALKDHLHLIFAL